MLKNLISIALSVALFSSAAASASLVTTNFIESGGDVVGTSAGSIDLSGTTFITNDSQSLARVSPTDGFFFFSAGDYTGYSAVFNDLVFGTGGFSTANSHSGDILGMWSSINIFYTGSNYVSDTALYSTATWNDASFASLGMTEGSYEYTFGNNTWTVNVGEVGTVPTPATLALFGLGLAGLGWSRRKKAEVNI